MDRTELLSLAFEMLPDAVGDLLRESADPADYVLTAAEADSPLGELLLRRDAAPSEDAVCLMLPIETLARVLEAYPFDAATGERLSRWLAGQVGPERYRVVAIGRGGIAAVTIDTTGEPDTDDSDDSDDSDEAPLSLLPH